MPRCNANVCEKRKKTHFNKLCLKYNIEEYSGDICSLTKFKVGIGTDQQKFLTYEK